MQFTFQFYQMIFGTFPMEIVFYIKSSKHEIPCVTLNLDLFDLKGNTSREDEIENSTKKLPLLLSHTELSSFSQSFSLLL